MVMPDLALLQFPVAVLLRTLPVLRFDCLLRLCLRGAGEIHGIFKELKVQRRVPLVVVPVVLPVVA